MEVARNATKKGIRVTPIVRTCRVAFKLFLSECPDISGHLAPNQEYIDARKKRGVSNKLNPGPKGLQPT